jgi:acyl-CoA synthetase (AMP-forming)/AMP-acid ligase II
VLLKGNDASSILRAIRDEHVTIMWTLGPWARDLVERVQAGDLSVSEGEYGSLRLTHMGAQPIPRDLIESWKAIWSWCDYDTDYGLTEAGGPGCMHLGVENGHKAGSIGVPGMSWQARVVDDAGEELPRGEIGELVVKGPGVMRGYLDDPVTARRVLSDGWLRTGDLVFIDNDGFAWLVDRKNDLIIVGGENVYPSEVEELVRDLSGVRDAVACGMSDIRLGEIVALLVEPTGAGPSLESIEELCKARLPWYKRPRVIQLGTVPRNSTGKVDRGRVKGILNAGWR